MRKHDFVIADLTKGDGIWRIDWFGNLAYPDLSRSWTQPAVLVKMSLHKRDSGQVYVSSFGRPETHQAWVPIAQLPLVSVGDLWQNGRLVERPDYALETFDNLMISDETTKTIKAGSQDENGRFFLPMHEHPWHMAHTQAYCTHIALPDGRQIIVPCWELANFYFGTSGTLLRRLVQPGVKTTDLYTDKRENGYLDKCVYLQLTEGLKCYAATDVARIAFSSEAQFAAIRISRSCLRASAAGIPIYPHTNFPFTGLTRLVAAGKWVANGSTFVVFNLRSCSHPFPFAELRYKTAKARKVRIPDTTTAPAPSARTYRVQAVSVPALSKLRFEDPGTGRSSKVREVLVDPKFPDLENKPVWHSGAISVERQTPRELVGSRAVADADESTGDPTGTRPIRSVDVEQTTPRRQSERIPVFVEQAIRTMQLASDASFELLRLEGSPGPVFSVPQLPNEDGEISPACFAVGAGGKSYQRRAAVLRIDESGQLQVGIVVERASLRDEHVHCRLPWPADDSSVAALAFQVIAEQLIS